MDLKTAKRMVMISEQFPGMEADLIIEAVEVLRHYVELFEMNLCPHALRYGRSCDDGPTDKEVREWCEKNPPT